MLYKMSVPKAFDAQLKFHAMTFFTEYVARKNLNCFQNSVNSTLAGRTVQLLQKDWNVLTRLCPLGPPRVVIQLYL